MTYDDLARAKARADERLERHATIAVALVTVALVAIVICSTALG
jgi:hypothetical protein